MTEPREHERVAEQVRAAIGGAANPTQAGFGVVGIDQASEAVMSVIDSILSARDSHFEARNRMTEQSDHWRARAKAAESKLDAVRELADDLLSDRSDPASTHEAISDDAEREVGRALRSILESTEAPE